MALYHTTRGPVDYTVVGSPTIVDGILSNSNGENYIKTTSQLNLTDNFYFKLKFKKTSGSDNFRLFMFEDANFNCQLNSNSVMLESPYNTYTTLGTLPLNVWGVLELAGNSGIITSTFTDLSTEQQTIKTIDVSNLTNQRTVYLGRSWSASTYTNGGVIDLNNTYIKVNGQPWFGVCPVEVKKHQLRGPVGYTVVGSPTIVDGIASGFSGSNYLETTSVFNPDSSATIEIFARIKTPETFNAGWSVFANNGPSVSNDGRSLGIYIGRNYRTFNIYGYDLTYNTVQANTWYKVKCVCSGQSQTMTIYNDDDSVFATLTDVRKIKTFARREVLLGGGITNLTQAGFGEIDLNNTYIKVNDKLWFFQPAPTKYIVKDDKLVWADQGLYLTGPVNYTVVGSPTIVDGVASGFSTDNYLKISSNPSSENLSSYKAQIKFTTSTIGTSMCLGGGAVFRGGFRINAAGQLQADWYDGANREELVSTVAANTSYIATMEFKNSSVVVKLINANTSAVIEEKVFASTSFNLTNNQYCFGYQSFVPSVGPFNGSIDLNETYIKVNDQLWFYGKNYASKNIAPVPAGYTYGTTTTPSIGYVDMRTQQFTAAPQGATIGRDE